MTKLSFEGDLKEISAPQLDFIADVLEERDFTNGKVTIEPVGQVGDNYVANVKRISVEKDGSVFKMVAKIAPTQEMLRTTMNTPLWFSNEHYMYTKVLPKFAELEAAAKIPKSERLRFAECYGCSMEAPYEVILLEDLKMSNFIMFDRHVSLTDESVKLTLKSFAIYHSLSYALKHQEPEVFEEFSRKLVNSYAHMAEMEVMKVYMENLEQDVLKVLDTDRQKRLVKGSISQLSNIALKNLKIARNSKYSVIQQGDPWTNNILFRLKDDVPVECCMIDYQLSNENSPVTDIEYMIFNCTDYKTRSKHFHEWIDYYHTELDKCLANFGLKVNLIYPRDQLDADLRRHGKQFFGVSVMLANILMREVKEAEKFKEANDNELSMEEMTELMSISNMEKSSMERFKNRVDGLIESFLELGYIVPAGRVF